jgi:hypothetical protein
LGLIIKHHLVQIRPVAVRAPFCVKLSFSAGRAKSLIPAITSAHFMTGAQKCTVLRPMGESHMRLNQLGCGPSAVVDCHLLLLDRKPLLRVWRAWKPANEVLKPVLRKMGRAARKMVEVAEDIVAGGIV